MKQMKPYPDTVRALFKATGMNSEADAMMHAAVGIAGEAGELLDAVKKVWVYCKPLDIPNAIEELGDLEFHMEALRQLIGVSREEVLQANQEKLAKRYPGGVYSDQYAQMRLDKDQLDPASTIDNDRYQPRGAHHGLCKAD